jgi:hypothetical protein
VIHYGVIKQQMVPYIEVEHDMLLFFLSMSVLFFDIFLVNVSIIF